MFVCIFSRLILSIKAFIFQFYITFSADSIITITAAENSDCKLIVLISNEKHHDISFFLSWSNTNPNPNPNPDLNPYPYTNPNSKY